MLSRINDTGSPNPWNSAHPQGMRRTILPLLLLVALFLPTCRTAIPDPSEAIPEGLPPLMTQMRLLSRDFKRALVIENQDQYKPLARALLEQAGQLQAFGGPEAFTSHAEALIRKGERLTEALPDAPRSRIEALFGEMMDTCLACHLAYRPE